jgi:hypothetical protein
VADIKQIVTGTDSRSYQSQQYDERIGVPSIGTALTGLGASLQSAGNQTFNVQMRLKTEQKQRDEQLQAVNDASQIARLISEKRLNDQQLMNEFVQNYGGEPKDFHNNLVKYLDESFNKSPLSFEPMPDRVRNAISTTHQSDIVQYSSKALVMQSERVAATVKLNIEKALSNSSNIIFNEPSQFQKHLADLPVVFDSFSSLLPEEAINSMLDGAKEQLTVAYVKGLGRTDPQNALNFLKSDEAKTLIGHKSYVSLSSNLENELEQDLQLQQAQQAQEIKSLIGDHLTSIRETGKPVLSEAQKGILTPLQKKELKSQEAASSVIFKEFSGSKWTSFADSYNRIQQYKPIGGESDYETKSETYKQLEKHVLELEEAYRKDPVAFSQGNQRVKDAVAKDAIAGAKASIALQLKKGSKNSDINILTNQQANELGQQLNQTAVSGKADRVFSLLEQWKGEYGSITLSDGTSGFDIIIRQVGQSKNKLSDAIMTALKYSDSPKRLDIYTAAESKAPDLAKGINPTLVKTSKTLINREVEDYTKTIRSIPGVSGRALSELSSQLELTEKLALMGIGRGLKPNEAAKEAVRTIFPFEVSKQSNGTFILPKEINGKRVSPREIFTNSRKEQRIEVLLPFLQEGTAGKASITTFSHSGKQWQLRSDAATAFQNASKEYNIVLNSAYRSTEKQKQLRATYEASPNTAPMAAIPGTSLHEKGLAIDVQNWKEAKPFLEKYGFTHKPAKNDPWHFEYNKPLKTASINPIALKEHARKIQDEGFWVPTGDLKSVQLFFRGKDGQIRPVLNSNNKPYIRSILELSTGSKI